MIFRDGAGYSRWFSKGYLKLDTVTKILRIKDNAGKIISRVYFQNGSFEDIFIDDDSHEELVEAAELIETKGAAIPPAPSTEQHLRNIKLSQPSDSDNK